MRKSGGESERKSKLVEAAVVAGDLASEVLALGKGGSRGMRPRPGPRPSVGLLRLGRLGLDGRVRASGFLKVAPVTVAVRRSGEGSSCGEEMRSAWECGCG